MKRLRRGPQTGPEDDPILPTLREIVGFMCPAACALAGYGVGMYWSGFMAAFLCAMVGVGLGTVVTRAWARDFYL